MSRALVILWLSSMGIPLLAEEEPFELRKVVDGVYAAVARPAYKVNSNAAVIFLEKGVMVVDTHSKPSAAQALIQAVKGLTKKPVQYVVNTHFHWDHYQGNQAYPASWPQGLQIISSEATHRNIQQRGIPRIKHQILALPREISDLKSRLNAAGSEEDRVQIRGNLRQAEAYLEELKLMQATLPTMTFERSFILRDPERTVHLLWMGLAHTDGDIVVYLPQEKVIVTGDLLQGNMPYMGDSYPYEWIETLKQVEDLDFDYVISGHGAVLEGKSQFQLWRDYLSDLLEATTDAYARGLSLNDTVEEVRLLLQTKYAHRFPAGVFNTSVNGNIQKAYRVVGGVQE